MATSIGAKSSRKGAAFERLVARKLSWWVSDGKRDDLFWRSVQSGGSALPSQVGDIAAIDSQGEVLTSRFVIECKHRNAAVISAFVYGEGGILRKWWSKVCLEAKQVNRRPLLIVREQCKPILVGLRPRDLALIFRLQHGIECPASDLCLIPFNELLSASFSAATKPDSRGILPLGVLRMGADGDIV